MPSCCCCHWSETLQGEDRLLVSCISSSPDRHHNIYSTMRTPYTILLLFYLYLPFTIICIQQSKHTYTHIKSLLPFNEKRKEKANKNVKMKSNKTILTEIKINRTNKRRRKNCSQKKEEKFQLGILCIMKINYFHEMNSWHG